MSYRKRFDFLLQRGDITLPEYNELNLHASYDITYRRRVARFVEVEDDLDEYSRKENDRKEEKGLEKHLEETEEEEAKSTDGDDVTEEKTCPRNRKHNKRHYEKSTRKRKRDTSL
ncbi:hypothetical protein BJ508DRAFT_334183 [Ascobolus immersus RN42]|uniref:Uncharacterized protein n=1 Tax=Ascobolus immersus RN42 TaxID=1160509 RepID=A0A3N4HH42_ASCIM|nr:hypothetical protein BJ508DRAFT_334183 [Ascobolus immersus RN42]